MRATKSLRKPRRCSSVHTARRKVTRHSVRCAACEPADRLRRVRSRDGQVATVSGSAAQRCPSRRFWASVRQVGRTFNESSGRGCGFRPLSDVSRIPSVGAAVRDVRHPSFVAGTSLGTVCRSGATPKESPWPRRPRCCGSTPASSAIDSVTREIADTFERHWSESRPGFSGRATRRRPDAAGLSHRARAHLHVRARRVPHARAGSRAGRGGGARGRALRGGHRATSARPLYNLGIPAGLKTWLDRIYTDIRLFPGYGITRPLDWSPLRPRQRAWRRLRARHRRWTVGTTSSPTSAAISSTSSGWSCRRSSSTSPWPTSTPSLPTSSTSRCRAVEAGHEVAERMAREQAEAAIA